MEVTVEVHTVHPTSKGAQAAGKDKAGAYGSWYTPESSPTNAQIPKFNPAIQLQDELRKIEHDGVKFELLKLQLFNVEPVLKSKDVRDEKEVNKDELHKPKMESAFDDGNAPPEYEGETVPYTVEAPQSPVPSSPSRSTKGDSWSQLLGLCNMFWPIDPQGQGYIMWLFLVTFCYSYNAWCIPLRATFPYQTPDNLATWMTLDYFCDLIYLLDVAVIKPRLMFVSEGFWVDDPVETKKNYKSKAHYKFDVISLLPLDLLYVVFGTNAVILRLPRVLKLQAFWSFHQAMDRILSSPYVVRIGKTLFYIFFLIHLNACAYYLMSVHIGLGTNGWVYDNKGNAYIRCFYFATKTATSIGKNPKPENTIEYLYMTFAWLMGVFVFALLIGQIRDIIATASRARTEYRKRVDNSIRYLRRLNMPVSLQRRVACWFNYTWTSQRCFDEQKILDYLPFNMKRDVSLAVHMSTLSKVQLFRDCSTSLLRDLVLQLRPVSCLPGDVVVRRGDVGHHMYIVKSGECCVMSPDESEVLAILKEGSVFGEISLLGIEGLRRRTATVISRGYATLFALSRNDLESALQQHKEAAQILRLRADRIIRENAARQVPRAAKSGKGGDGRRRVNSAASKRRLSAVSEQQPYNIARDVPAEEQPRHTDSVHHGEEQKHPIPTIILTTE